MTASWRPVVLALGSNLGDRRETLKDAADAIARITGVRVLTMSPVYETVPVGGPPQPDYLNAVVLARTTLPTRDLLDRLHEVEAEFDRVRLVRWGPRTLDIDIITVEGELSDDPELTLPHPRAHERAFVLAPWHDIDPDADLPGHGPIADLLHLTDRSGIAVSPPGDGPPVTPRSGGCFPAWGAPAPHHPRRPPNPLGDPLAESASGPHAPGEIL
jgi:2-amino-4-hydroxy-6-hydroxymethyldihydropteridine diphosphokinase